jgi:hypothetical protein
MRPKLSFVGKCRLLWLGVSLASVIACTSGYPEMAPIVVMLSFPSSVVAGIAVQIAIDTTTRIGPIWVQTLLFGTAALLGGYLQWFVIGRALATRLLARLPSGRLHVMARAGVVFVFLGLAAFGLVMVREQQQAMRYFLRAMDVREGMTLDEVRSLLGEPRQASPPSVTDAWRDCDNRDAVRIESYWFEHEWLPRRFGRSGFVLAVCSDRQRRVVEIHHIEVD